MNDPRTCVYGHARKFGACGERGTCTRPRGLACLCGLVKARVPEPGPDKLTRPRNVYASRRLSGWTHKMVHTCIGCNEEFDTEHRAAFHLCVGAKDGGFAPPGAASPWTHSYGGRLIDSVVQGREPLPGFNCAGTVTGRISSHEPPFIDEKYRADLSSKQPEKIRQWLNGEWDTLTGTAQRSLDLEDLDLSKIEERVLAMCSCEEAAEIKREAWDALGHCPWDNWKPGRDVA